MDDNLPLIFTPLVRQPGVPIPDWLFGPAGVAGLPAPLSLPQGVNVAVGIDIIEVGRVRKVYERTENVSSNGLHRHGGTPMPGKAMLSWTLCR